MSELKVIEMKKAVHQYAKACDGKKPEVIRMTYPNFQQLVTDATQKPEDHFLATTLVTKRQFQGIPIEIAEDVKQVDEVGTDAFSFLINGNKWGEDLRK